MKKYENKSLSWPGDELKVWYLKDFYVSSDQYRPKLAKYLSSLFKYFNDKF